MLWIIYQKFSQYLYAPVADHHLNIGCICRLIYFTTTVKFTSGPCIFFEVEVVRSSVSFMSELDSFYLGSIGLLGEYRPTSRKKHTCFFEELGHIHLETIQNFIPSSSRHFMQPAFLDIYPKEASLLLHSTVDTV